MSNAQTEGGVRRVTTFETRFSLHDVVVPIRQRYETVGDPCPVCEGTGRAALVKGGTVWCPGRDCSNGKINSVLIHPWMVADDFASAIGKITVERIADSEFGTETTTAYMIAATGIGSGTMWPEDLLFASVEDAQAECDKRNAVQNVEAPHVG